MSNPEGALGREDLGFEAIDVPDGRRGLWMRVTQSESRVELIAGREGGDAIVAFQVGQTVDGKLLNDLVDVMSALRYAVEVAKDNATNETDETLRRLVRKLASILSFTGPLGMTYRANGDVECKVCGELYKDHIQCPRETWITILCDGRRVKL